MAKHVEIQTLRNYSKSTNLSLNINYRYRIFLWAFLIKQKKNPNLPRLFAFEFIQFVGFLHIRQTRLVLPFTTEIDLRFHGFQNLVGFVYLNRIQPHNRR